MSIQSQGLAFLITIPALAALGWFFGPPSTANSALKSPRVPRTDPNSPRGNGSTPEQFKNTVFHSQCMNIEKLLESGQLEQALEESEALVSSQESNGDEGTFAYSLYLYSTALRANGRIEESLDRALSAAELVSEYPDRIPLLEATYVLQVAVESLVDASRFAEAELWAEPLMQSARKLTEKPPVSDNVNVFLKMLKIITIPLLKEGRFKKLHTYFAEAVPLAFEHCPLSDLCWQVLELLTNSYHQQNKVQESLQVLWEYLRIIGPKEDKDGTRALDVVQRAALLLFVTENYNQCEVYLNEAASMINHFNFPPNVSLFADMICCFYEQGKQDKLKETIDQLCITALPEGEEIPLFRSKFLTTTEISLTVDATKSIYSIELRVNRVRPHRKEGEREGEIERKISNFYVEVTFENTSPNQKPYLITHVANTPQFTILSKALPQIDEIAYYSYRNNNSDNNGKKHNKRRNNSNTNSNNGNNSNNNSNNSKKGFYIIINIYKNDKKTELLGVHHQVAWPTFTGPEIKIQ